MSKTDERFWSLMKEDKTQISDTKRLQLFYVLARTDELWNVMPKIYNVKYHCLENGWDEVFDCELGKMLKRTAHLYNSQNEDIDTVELFCDMDFRNKETMVNAQKIYLNLFNFADTVLE